MTFEPCTIWVLGLPTLLVCLGFRIIRIPWRWVFLAGLSGYSADVIHTIPIKLPFFAVFVAAILWIGINHRDPDEPFRRLKKKISASMTRVQQQSFQRQQVEAFR